MAEVAEVPTSRQQWAMAGKVAVGIVVGVVAVAIVAPIALAVILGLATGH
jgi:hypothetical protein